MNKRKAAVAIRNAAREFERNGCMQSRLGLDGYSCNAVWRVLGRSKTAENAYKFLFGFEDIPSSNESELWKMEGDDLCGMRVLMLCFAAAMIEVGDFFEATNREEA